MSSQASRTSFSKFTLKPSALSQLTANFNRKLEEIEVPKIEPIDLIGREANSHSNQENINKDGTKTDGTEGTSTTSSDQAAAPSKEFIFGENITERVVNKPEPTSASAAATGEGGESTAEATSEATNGESDDKTGEKQTSSNLPTTSSSNNISSWLNDSENTEKYAAALHESDLYTLCKLNCKLYVLEADKANWLERGYGILKVIETNDGNNCKIMMWTDKCFRVILNTKFFEKMKIDRANNKSLRFNAFDNGTIRIFLIKATNQNDCDELQNVLSSRLELFLSTLQSSKSSASNSQEAEADADDSTSRTSRKVTKFKCDCTVSRESNPSQSIRAKIHLYMLEAGSSDSVTSPPTPSNSHQLFLEINEAFDSDQKINLNSYLKLVKIKKQKITPGKKGHKYLKFEIVDLAQAKSNIKYNVCINDRASASQFFSLYKKEPKFTSPDDSSSNGTNAFDKDLDDDQQEGVDNEEDEEEDSEESDENEDEDDDGEKSSSSSASSRSRPRSPPSNDDDSLLDRTNNSSITAATNDETSASNVLKRKSDVSDSDVRLAKKPGLDESAVASEEKSEEKKDEGEEKKEASESVPVVPTAAAPSCGGGGTKRNLEESVTSEGGDDSTAADENEGSKKTKVSTEETSQD